METKLTLRMNDEIINAAKIYARQQGMSLSKIVENHLRIISSKNTLTFKPTPILSEISGVLEKTPSEKDLRKEYYEYIEEKYL